MRSRLVAGLAVMIIILMIFLNILPITVVRNQLIETKMNSLYTSAGTISSALSGFASLNQASVNTVLKVLDVSSFQRIIVTVEGGLVIYDSLGESSASRRFALLPEINTAMGGDDVFLCTYSETAFISRAACPIIIGGNVAGTVYLYEEDSSPTKLLNDTRTKIFLASVAVGILSIGFIFLLTRSMKRRLSMLTNGIREMRSGNYGHRVNVSGNDELSEISSEFCLLADRLQTTENTRQRLISDVSHELKTPLTAIKLLSDSIIQTPDMPPEDIRDFLGDINDQILRLTRITESLLTINRLDTAKTVEPSVCDLAKTVEKSAVLLRTMADSASVSITVDADGEYPVKATDDGLYHVVFNLMENAVKYNRPGGSVAVSLKKQDGVIILTVKDTGIGIPQSEISHIYERFYRVDKDRSRETGGTGLGLSIVREWVEQMGGHIDVFSVLGEGTRFIVTLPMAEKEVLK